MSASIVPYLSIKNERDVLEDVREIFFESSIKKDFQNETEREAFYHKYLGYYVKAYPELIWIARLDKKVLGYVVAGPETLLPELLALQPHLEIFRKECEKFPAHLHINCHHEARGMGVGGMLMEAVIQELKARKISGLHIMTGPTSKNRSFYKKLGFEFETQSNFHGSPILFMGKSL